jgi:hypothetical protein
MASRRQGNAVGQTCFDLDDGHGCSGTRRPAHHGRPEDARSPSGAARRALMRRALGLILSASIGLAACAGPRAHSASPLAAAQSEPVASTGVACPPTEPGCPGHPKPGPPPPSSKLANEIGWGIFFIVALPVLVPAFVASLPFGSWKAFR